MLVMVKRAAKRKLFRPTQKNVKLLSSKLVYDGPVFQVFTDMVQEGAYKGRRDVIRHSGSIVVLPVKDVNARDPEILLIEQYRYAASARLWELTAGRIDPGENMLAAAKRELLEETGFRARKWKRMFRFYASPGFLDETMDAYLATGLIAGAAQPEEDEQITARFFPLSRAVKMVYEKRICDAKTMCGLLWFGYNRAAGR